MFLPLVPWQIKGNFVSDCNKDVIAAAGSPCGGTPNRAGLYKHDDAKG